ncbi:MAG: hypothetical protein ACTSV7_03715 [Candidatus Baldrarchaeia archaeon]
MKVAESVLDLIGGTPLVKIRKLNPNKNVTMYAKRGVLTPSRTNFG